jgi:hypothetical protein
MTGNERYRLLPSGDQNGLRTCLDNSKLALSGSRIENPELNDYGASLGWHGTSSIRAKGRSLSSARASTLKKDLTESGIVREAMLQQLFDGGWHELAAHSSGSSTVILSSYFEEG